MSRPRGRSRARQAPIQAARSTSRQMGGARRWRSRGGVAAPVRDGRAGWSSRGRTVGRPARPAAPSGRLRPAAAEWRCRWRRSSAGRSPAAPRRAPGRPRWQPGTRAARHSAAAPVPVPASSTRLAGLGRDGGREQDGVDRDPVAASRLAEAAAGRRAAGRRSAPAQPRLVIEPRLGRVGQHPHARARDPRPATSSRRGNAPMLPSTLLMWLSSKQAVDPVRRQHRLRPGEVDEIVAAHHFDQVRVTTSCVASPRGRGFAIARGAC